MTESARDYWRTLDELTGDPAFRERLYNEFPSEVEAIRDPVARRRFLKLMGASMALAGVTACTRQPAETIVPYVRQPEEIVPGRPLFYATAMPMGGSAIGLLVESHEGRPTKIEGNPLHPSSLGATDVFAQGAVLGLYDPDRSQTITNRGEIRPWSAFLGTIRAAVTAQQRIGGAGLRVLTESVTSPTLAAQLRDLLARYPSARWHQWDPIGSHNARAGARMVFGEYIDAHLQVERADVIVALDSDFLASGPGALRHARAFARRRQPDSSAMSRLYVVESLPTSTGARADHRLPLKPGAVESVARLLASAVGMRAADVGTRADTGASPEIRKWVDALAKDLNAHRGTSLIVAGEGQPGVVHALAHAMNASLGNAGRTVSYTEPVEAEPTDHVQSLRALTNDMSAGKVDVLIVVGGNPVFTAPADIPFVEAMSKTPLRVHLGLYDDETSALCHWHIPEAHFLEAWSDTRGHDGTVSIVQPLIAPLYGGRSAHELLAAMSDRPERSGYDIVREFWSQRFRPQGAPTAASTEFEQAWRRWLHDGVVPDTASRSRPASIDLRSLPAAQPAAPAAAGLDIVFRHDPSVLDGRFANNGWLQELPKPVTKLTWDNAVLMSPSTAERLGLAAAAGFEGGEHGEIVARVAELRYGGRRVHGPVFPVAGHPDDCVTVHLGYGRSRAGRVGTGLGFNAGALRTADALWFGSGLELAATGERYQLACTQYHHLMEGRGMVRAVTRDEFVRNPASIHEGHEAPLKTITLYPADHAYDGYKWGMAIDVNACIGCNACVVGCQAENNIAVVGKDQVLRGREMHWLRIDHYNRGPVANPESFFQPVPCMQCENAPCEVVCPVGATVHSDEGLNDMVYNRCVGTRYCSNNCPYKVRRFNYLLYQDWDTPTFKLQRNPDVSVRSRGVMEKCTYCVQRINAAKIEAEKQDRPVKDGDIVTACQQACPAEAIVFGNLNDPNSRVAKLQAQARNYSMLADLNTRPRTTYLAAVRNVNPELDA